MAKFLLFVALFVVVDAAHKYQPEFQDGEASDITKVDCNNDHDVPRNEHILGSRCGSPKEVFVDLNPHAAHEQVTPSAVWVKRCVGLCDYEAEGSKCVPIETVIRQIPVRIHDVKTDKESCSTYPVEEHVSCGCCSASESDCGDNKVLNPRKCTCNCPDAGAEESCPRPAAGS